MMTVVRDVCMCERSCELRRKKEKRKVLGERPFKYLSYNEARPNSGFNKQSIF